MFGLTFLISVSDITFYEVQLFNHLVEIIIYLSRTHQMRSKFYIFTEGLSSRIAQLLSAPQKHLKLTALKFFRQCVGLQDESYNKELTTKQHFGPILNIVYETMPRDNLLNSACLELFEYIKRENLKPLIRHLAEHYGSRLREIDYVDTFQTILLRYDQMINVQDADMTLFSNDAGMTTPPNQQRGNINGNRGWQGVKEMDADEEAYFNTSDDEEELQEQRDSPTAKRLKVSPKSTTPLSNGVASSPLLKSLVDYPDDEDEEIMDTPPTNSHSKSRPTTQSQQHILPSSPSPSSSSEGGPRLAPSPVLTTPPSESLREKRRREQDDDDDELGKLSSMGSHKRRNSSSSGSSLGNASVNSNTGNALRRRKAFGANSKTSSDASPIRDKEKDKDRDRDKGSEREKEKEKDKKSGFTSSNPTSISTSTKKMEIHIGARDKDAVLEAATSPSSTNTTTTNITTTELLDNGDSDGGSGEEPMESAAESEWEKVEKVDACG